MSVKRRIVPLIGIALVFCLAACGSGRRTEPKTTAESEAAQRRGSESGATDLSTDSTTEPDVSRETENKGEERMRLWIGHTEVSVAWEDNESAAALIGLAAAGPLVIDMSMYGGFEQVGSLGADLPRKDEQTTAKAGDIMLYSGNQIVVFYGSHAWAYTRLGRITDKTAAEMADLLGGGSVTVTISCGG